MKTVKRWMMTVVVTSNMLAASSAWAEIVTYTERVTFEAAIKDAITVSFSGIAQPNDYKEVPPGAIYGGVTFQEKLFGLNGVTWGQGFPGIEVVVLSTVGATVIPPSGQTALGIDIYRLVESQGSGWAYGKSQFVTVTVNYSDSQTTVFNLDWGLTEPGALQSVSKFVGVTSSNRGVTITSVVFNGQVPASGLKEPVIDNFTYGMFNDKSLTEYNNRAAFEAAIKDSTTLSFNGLVPVGQEYDSISADSVIDEVAFVKTTPGGNPDMYPLNGASWGQGFPAGLEVLCLHAHGETATPPVGQTAIGIDIYRLVNKLEGYWNYGKAQYVAVTVNFSNGKVVPFVLDWGVTEPDAFQSVSKFVGVTSSDPAVTVTSVLFHGVNSAKGLESAVIDNFTYGKVIFVGGTLIMVQ